MDSEGDQFESWHVSNDPGNQSMMIAVIIVVVTLVFPSPSNIIHIIVVHVFLSFTKTVESATYFCPILSSPSGRPSSYTQSFDSVIDHPFYSCLIFFPFFTGTWPGIRSSATATYGGWPSICTGIRSKRVAPAVTPPRGCTVAALSHCATTSSSVSIPQ